MGSILFFYLDLKVFCFCWAVVFVSGFYNVLYGYILFFIFLFWVITVITCGCFFCLIFWGWGVHIIVLACKYGFFDFTKPYTKPYKPLLNKSVSKTNPQKTL